MSDKLLPQNIPLTWHMYRAMGAIGISCAFVIALVYLVTLPYIEANKNAAIEAAIFSVMPDADSMSKLVWRDGVFTAAAEDQQRDNEMLYAAFDASGRHIGFAITAIGMGYQDRIELMYAYSPQLQRVIGMKVISNRETPGLGNKIGSDKQFLDNFRQLDVTLNVSRNGLANPVSVAKKGKLKLAWQIDSISGATISSKAVASIINSSVNHWAPRLVGKHIEKSNLKSTPTSGN